MYLKVYYGLFCTFISQYRNVYLNAIFKLLKTAFILASPGHGCNNSDNYDATSVTSKKSPKLYKSCPIWFHYKNGRFWQQNFRNVGNLGWIGSCCYRLWKVSQSTINRPIWSHWPQPMSSVSIFRFSIFNEPV